MINIRPALEMDNIFIIGTRVDLFLGDREFYEIANDEIMKVKNYADEFVKTRLNTIKVIVNEEKNIGSFAVYEYEDGVLIDSLGLIRGFDQREIKEFVIKYILSSNYGNIYTFVYKNKIEDLEIFKSLNFTVINEENDKYKLKICKQ